MCVYVTINHQFTNTGIKSNHNMLYDCESAHQPLSCPLPSMLIGKVYNVHVNSIGLNRSRALVHVAA